MDTRQVGRELISDAEFNHLLMNALEWAGQYMEGEESISPHLMAFYAPGEGDYIMSVFVTPGFEDDESKVMTMAAMGVKAAEGDDPLAAVFLITEAWMSTRPEGEGLPDVPPSEDPERVEVIIISGSTIDQRQNQAVVRMERREGLMYAGEVMSAPFIDDGKDTLQNYMLMRFWRSYAEGIMRRKGYM
jgi:hypothetical protein